VKSDAQTPPQQQVAAAAAVGLALAGLDQGLL
jgi:hypothetical protein